MKILLSYMYALHTTGTYYERLLRSRKDISLTTIGPSISEALANSWGIDTKKYPIVHHNIPTKVDENIGRIYEQLDPSKRPDLFIWIDSGNLMLNGINKIQCPKIAYLIDTHHNISRYDKYCLQFDYIFVANLSHVAYFQNQGFNAHWLPLACDPLIHQLIPIKRQFEIGFVGSISPGSKRFEYLTELAKFYNLQTQTIVDPQKMSLLYSQSQIVFNNCVGGSDLNMRFFESMACGAMLLSDMAYGSGQDIMFDDRSDYVCYNESNLIRLTKTYLAEPDLMRQVAEQGRNKVLASHTYNHRLEDLLNVVAGKKSHTFTPSEFSQMTQKIHNSKMPTNLINSFEGEVSYVIPVLDYSPASPYNIKTLLTDLENVKGEVIVVFNNEVVANEMKTHPRISRSITISQNIGVSRAWNIGLDACRTKYAFILNSDLKLGASTISELINYIKTQDKAALVGPEGTFFNYQDLKDYYYLGKGQFNVPIKVDAVAGFLFVINLDLFNQNNIRFDPRYTPCYKEEWDIGYQLKLKNLECHILPTSNYDHQWSGSIRSYKKIRYFDLEETPTDIGARNAILFKEKWDSLATIHGSSFLQSGWKSFALNLAEQSIVKGHLEQAENLLRRLNSDFPYCKYVLATLGLLFFHKKEYLVSVSYYEKSLEADPLFSIAKENLAIIKSRIILKS